MATSEQIILTRKRLRMTQGELAAHFGVNLATIWRWENNGVPENGLAAKSLDAWIEDHREKA